MAAKRDYKKEYAKFQSSPKRKKYRAELNKYNREKGNYGNGDGKDASHKDNKISGYETESKNRGRREKSRKKGSTRKTETVMPTLREFIIQEINAELDERLSKRWNIVEAGKDPVQSIVNQKAIERAVKKGDASAIQKIIGKAATYRRELARQSHMTGTRRQIRHVDGVIQNLVRILVHVKQATATEGQAWGKPEPPASAVQSKEIDPDPVLSEAEMSNALVLNVGDVVYYRTEDGTVVSMAPQARHGFPNRVVRVAFSDDTVVFGRGKDGKYRAQGTPLNSPHTLTQ